MTWLLVLLLTVHVALVFVGAAGPVFSVLLERREHVAGEPFRRLGDWLARVTPAAWVLGGLLGVLLGWLRWDEGFSAALGRLASRVHFGVWEYLFSLVLMLGYIWTRRWAAPTWKGRIGRAILPLLSGTNSLYHFPVLFVVLSELQRRGEAAGERLTSAEFRQYLVDPLVVARSLHVAFAALAVTGVALVVHSARRAEEGQPAGVVSWSAGWTLMLTILQAPLGMWLVMQEAVHPTLQRALLGGDTSATLLLAAAIVGALAWMHLAAGLALGQEPRKLSTRLVLVSIATLLCMAATSARLEMLL